MPLKGWYQTARKIKQSRGKFEKRGKCRYCLGAWSPKHHCRRRAVRMKAKRDKKFAVLMSQVLRGK